MLGLTYLRELFNLSMTDLAEQLGVSKQIISKYEGEKTRISDKRLKQIEEMFKIPAKYIAKELTELDKLEMQKAKLDNEIGEYEYEFDEVILDEETGEEITITRTELDSGALFHIYTTNYQIAEQKLLTNIKNSLDQCFINGQEDEYSIDGGLVEANELLDLYEEFFAIANNSNVNKNTLQSILRAINVAYGKTITSDKFIRKIAKTIKDYDEKNRKDWGEIADLYKDK